MNMLFNIVIVSEEIGDSKLSAVPEKAEQHGCCERHEGGLEGANRRFATGSRIPLSPY